MKKRIIFLLEIIFFSLLNSSCENDSSNMMKNSNETPPATPVNMTLTPKIDTKTCQSNAVINGTVEWLNEYIHDDCIEIEAIVFGCQKEVNAIRFPDAVDEEGGFDAQPDDEPAPSPADEGCDSDATRTLILKKGDEIISHVEAAGNPIQETINPPFRFCNGDEKLDFLLTLSPVAPLKSTDDIWIKYTQYSNLENTGEESGFEEYYEYRLLENGCVEFL